MRSIIRKSQFKRDFKKLRSSNRDIELLKTVIQKLAAGEELPASFRDHALGGNYPARRRPGESGARFRLKSDQSNFADLSMRGTQKQRKLFRPP